MTAVDSRPAVLGGTPVRTDPWPEWPVWDQEDIEAVAGVIRSGRWFNAGRNVELAARFSELHQARYAVPCCNGTQALELALRACGVKAGDEVITSPYTFIATASAIVQVNGAPVFADVDPGTLNLDPEAAEAAITPRTRAIVPVHVLGCPADLTRFVEIGRRRGVAIIEDAAQAHLAEWNSVPVGAQGTAGSFSFQASKNLTSGEGGIVLTNNEEIFEHLWSLANCGRVRNGGWYEHRVLSGNYRLSELQAALLLTQMERLDEQSRRREENALYLAREMAGIPGLIPLKRAPEVTRHAYHLFGFRLSAELQELLARDQFLTALQAEGIPCSPGYTPLYRSPAFIVNPATHPYAGSRDYAAVHLPQVEAASASAVWLNQRMLLAARRDMDDILKALAVVAGAARRGEFRTT